MAAPVRPVPDSDGYVDGQRDRTLVLDLFAERHEGRHLHIGAGHPAGDLSPYAFLFARNALEDAGLIRRLDSVTMEITPAGLAAHAESQRAVADLAARIAAA